MPDRCLTNELIAQDGHHQVQRRDQARGGDQPDAAEDALGGLPHGHPGAGAAGP